MYSTIKRYALGPKPYAAEGHRPAISGGAFNAMRHALCALLIYHG